VEWLNYHHLLYFWVVAREGSIVRAAGELGLAHPTISAQIRSLEASLGNPLFQRVGRRLVLTEVGAIAYRYAEEIFANGRELLDTVRGRATGNSARLRVGVADVLPKALVRRLLDPAVRLDPPAHIVCREDTPARLMASLSQHTLDVVLSDAPPEPGGTIRVFHHLLGESEVAFFGTPELARRARRDFPRSLQKTPVLLPTGGATLRRSLESWLEAQGVRAWIVGEFDDSALLKAFGQDGLGVFPALAIMAQELRRRHGVVPLGRVPNVRERFYAITIERRIKNPAVIAICESARREVFHADGRSASTPRSRRSLR
jgi:LysR family transcriptional activator of nhaA